MKLSKLLFLLLIVAPASAKIIEIKFNCDRVQIDTIQIVNIGGIKQYISIKGSDLTKPLLLFLHGGPGGSVMNFADKFTSKLQKHFIVVQWDQRETNKTLELNSSPDSLTVSLFQNDTRLLIDTLLKQFKQNKLYLVAHSWGSVLGFYMANKFPNLLHAYVAISPMVDQLESERMTLMMLKQKAIQCQNDNETKELSLIKIPFENSQQLYYARKWLFSFDGQQIADRDTSSMIKYIQEWSAVWLSVWNEAMRQDLTKGMVQINCPVYFCLGRKDYQTNFSIAEQYFNSLFAPKKRLFWFSKSGHLIPNSEPALLQNIIINEILPQTL